MTSSRRAARPHRRRPQTRARTAAAAGRGEAAARATAPAARARAERKADKAAAAVRTQARQAQAEWVARPAAEREPAGLPDRLDPESRTLGPIRRFRWSIATS